MAPNSNGRCYTVLVIDEDGDVVQKAAWLTALEPLQNFISGHDELRRMSPVDLIIVSGRPDEQVCGHSVRYLLRQKTIGKEFLEALFGAGVLTLVAY